MTIRRVLLVALLLLVRADHAAAQTPLTIGEIFTLDSKVMSEPRKVLVWTPGDAANARAYPVLYLTDAERQFGHTVTTVEFLSRNGRIPPMIVVGVFNTDRTRDLTPYRDKDDETTGQMATAGGADRFLKFMETELIPWVESRYRTETFRAFAGHSFGGLFGIHALATRPELFDAIVAVSPSLPWRQGEPVKRVETMLGSQRNLACSLYVTLGDEGAAMQTGFDRLRAVLEEHAGKSMRWSLVKMPDEDHGSIVLRSHYEALENIFDGWRLPRKADGTYSGGLPAVDAHFGKLSSRLGWTVVPPEATINALGYAELQRRHLDDALAYFRANVRNHPGSANVYDSFGEGLEAAGQHDEALAQYEEALRRGEASKDPLTDAFREHRDALRAKMGSKP
jgi:predicted alpha/beta superfamily hydrolase